MKCGMVSDKCLHPFAFKTLIAALPPLRGFLNHRRKKRTEAQAWKDSRFCAFCAFGRSSPSTGGEDAFLIRKSAK